MTPARIAAYAARFRARHHGESPTVAEAARGLGIRQRDILRSERRTNRFWVCARNYCAEPIGLLFIEEPPCR